MFQKKILKFEVYVFTLYDLSKQTMNIEEIAITSIVTSFTWVVSMLFCLWKRHKQKEHELQYLGNVLFTIIDHIEVETRQRN